MVLAKGLKCPSKLKEALWNLGPRIHNIVGIQKKD